MKKVFLFIFIFPFFVNANAQEGDSTIRNYTINGYIKELESLRFDKINRSNIAGHILHNRLNVKWRSNQTFSFTGEIRNRLFLGELVNQTPHFVENLKNSNEYFNVQKAWINNDNLVLHTNVERLYFDIKKTRWNTRIGRQRINWGISNIWNPNDIFNAFNFLEVDYEERPGSDAIKLQYLTSDYSSLEWVYAVGGNKKNIWAAKYSFNQWNYDWQFIGGFFDGMTTVGLGWAGSMKDLGFKGELQYYLGDNFHNDQLNFTVGWDYMFKKGWYVNVGGLYNSRGLNQKVNDWSEVNMNLSVKNLMPAKYSYLVGFRKELTSLASFNFNGVYSPGIKLLILLPSLSYNISDKWDTDFVYQSFYMQQESVWNGMMDMGILRFRYSF